MFPRYCIFLFVYPNLRYRKAQFVLFSVLHETGSILENRKFSWMYFGLSNAINVQRVYQRTTCVCLKERDKFVDIISTYCPRGFQSWKWVYLRCGQFRLRVDGCRGCESLVVVPQARKWCLSSLDLYKHKISLKLCLHSHLEIRAIYSLLDNNIMT